MPDETPPAPLSYASAPTGKPYQRVKLPAGPVYFPRLCCNCLKPTDTQYTIRGNRIRGTTITGLAIAEALGANQFFELKVPVCNGCWRAYLKRQRSYWWLAPGVGALLGVSLVIPLAINESRQRAQDAPILFLVLGAFMLGMVGLLVGVSQVLRLADWCAKPPVKLRQGLLGGVILRFYNAAYVEPFLAAQQEEPRRLLEEATRQRDEQAQAMVDPQPAEAPCFYLINGEPAGPVSWERIRAMLSTGELLPESKLWVEGWPDWTPARDVENLVEPNA